MPNLDFSKPTKVNNNAAEQKLDFLWEKLTLKQIQLLSELVSPEMSEALKIATDLIKREEAVNLVRSSTIDSNRNHALMLIEQGKAQGMNYWSCLGKACKQRLDASKGLPKSESLQQP